DPSLASRGGRRSSPKGQMPRKCRVPKGSRIRGRLRAHAWSPHWSIPSGRGDGVRSSNQSTIRKGPVMSMARAWRGIVEEYRDRLPITANTPVVTLLEGGTPLVPATRVSELTGCEVYLKVEGLNPTGSFK